MKKALGEGCWKPCCTTVWEKFPRVDERIQRHSPRTNSFRKGKRKELILK
jgi:hypothetical protein